MVVRPSRSTLATGSARASARAGHGSPASAPPLNPASVPLQAGQADHEAGRAVQGGDTPRDTPVVDLAGGLTALNGRRLKMRSVFQPLIDLRDGHVRGYEALVRGPAGPLSTPEGLFAAARRKGLVAELDWACRASAFSQALAAGLRSPLGLFVNAEPEALGVPCPRHLLPVWLEAARRLHLVVELTERDLVARPAQLVHVVQELRELGCSIALDDVGAHPDSLTLMPVLEPDVVKLDIGLIHRAPDDDAARVLHAVAAQAERTGALVVAEGIETEEHLTTAIAYGASIGQGWLFARPSDNLAVVTGYGEPPPVRAGSLEGAGTPYAELAPGRSRTGSAAVVRVMTRQLLEQAALLSTAPVVLCVLPGNSEGATAAADLAALQGLADASALLGVLSNGPPVDLPAGVLQAALGETDPLGSEWDVVVLGAHFAAAVVARRTGARQQPSAWDEGWSFALTHDRDRVVGVVRSLLGRLAGAGAGDATYPDLVSPLAR